MTRQQDIDRRIDAFLGEGPTELPERTYDAVRDQIEHTRQRVVIGPWREPTMSNIARLAVAAVVLVAVGFGVTWLLPGPPESGVGGPPSPTPTTQLSPSLPPVSPSAIAPATLSIGQSFSVSMEFTATTAFRLWGDIGSSGKGWFKDSVDPPNGMGVTVWRVDNAQSDPCAGGYLDPPVGPSVDELADVLVNQPHTVVIEDIPVTLDGYSGRYLEYTAVVAECPAGRLARWVSNGSIREALDSEHDRLWILDVDGARVVIDAFDFPGASEEDRTELRAIVESVQIDPN